MSWLTKHHLQYGIWGKWIIILMFTWHHRITYIYIVFHWKYIYIAYGNIYILKKSKKGEIPTTQ